MRDIESVPAPLASIGETNECNEVEKLSWWSIAFNLSLVP